MLFGFPLPSSPSLWMGTAPIGQGVDGQEKRAGRRGKEEKMNTRLSTVTAYRMC